MRTLFMAIGLTGLISCKGCPERPDTSKISLEIKTQRYEKILFGLDTLAFEEGINNLASAFPGFHEDFTYRILNADPDWNENEIYGYVEGFVNAYRPVYDSSQLIFSDFSKYEEEIRQSMKYCKYYFPEYEIPQKIITYIGPLDGYGDILSEDAFIIGLHHHLGKNFSMYLSESVSQTYPNYITKRFDADHISVNCVSNVIDDLLPAYDQKQGEMTFSGQSLINRMVRNGRRLYLMSRLLPDKKEYLLIGYDESQLTDCYRHEKVIWDLFIKNNLLQSTDVNVIKNYIGESPRTQELGESAPGNIGSFSGWQIVKKFMEKHPETSLKELISMDPDIIYEKAKYKP